MRDKGYKVEYFAKPKDFDINTPHVTVINNTLEVHEDSADGNFFRKMEVDRTLSGSVQVAGTYASNHNMDLVILPMSATPNGFVINTSKAGAQFTSQTNQKEWVVAAVGKFGEWQPKNPNQDRKGQVSYL